MLAYVVAHKDVILSALLGLSEVIALFAGQGGILVSVINGLKAAGAKQPGA